jgi:N-acetylglucosamine-6-phosphate deacetylase
VALPPPPFSVTHLFNAMSGLDHRGGGLANIALAGLSTWAELNADGIHVNATGMKVASLCLPPSRLILTSDAVISAGLGHGNYRYFGQAVSSDATGVRYEKTGTLIGSSRLGMEIVNSFTQATKVPLFAAVASMSVTPATALGLASSYRRGLSEGAAADLFIWDKGLTSCRRPGSIQAPPGPRLSGKALGKA